MDWNIWMLEEKIVERTSKSYVQTLRQLYPFREEYIAELQKHLILPKKSLLTRKEA